jgi:hypothetical protein
MAQSLALAVEAPASSLAATVGLVVITPPMAPVSARNRNTKQLLSLKEALG